MENRVTIVVPSRKRPQKVAQMTKLFPDALWSVAENEATDYKVPAERKLVHPDSVVGIARKRQHILDTVKGPVFMVDDDIQGLWSNCGALGQWVKGPENIRQVIENMNECAEGFGAPVYGPAQSWDVRKFQPPDPFQVNGWCGTAIGFTADRSLKYDTDLLSQADIDFCLKALLKKRVVFVDKRFAFVCQRFNNAGGSAGIRSMDQYEAQIRKVVQRWGPWISYKKAKTTYRLGVAVPRRQPLDFGGE